MAELSSPLLRECVEKLAAADQRLDEVTAGLSAAQANFQPGPKKWSVCECLEHIAVTAESYFPGLEKLLQRGRERGITGSEPYGAGTWFGRYLLAALRAGPQAKKVNAPPSFRPGRGNHDLAASVRRLKAANGRLRGLCAAADGLALGRLRMGSPALFLLRISAAQVLETLVLHAHRHLGQAARVRQAPGFPAA